MDNQIAKGIDNWFERGGNPPVAKDTEALLERLCNESLRERLCNESLRERQVAAELREIIEALTRELAVKDALLQRATDALPSSPSVRSAVAVDIRFELAALTVASEKEKG